MVDVVLLADLADAASESTAGDKQIEQALEREILALNFLCYEGGGSVLQAERNDIVLKKTIMMTEGGLPLVLLGERDLPVALGHVDCGENLRSSHSLEVIHRIEAIMDGGGTINTLFRTHQAGIYIILWTP